METRKCENLSVKLVLLKQKESNQKLIMKSAIFVSIVVLAAMIASTQAVVKCPELPTIADLDMNRVSKLNFLYLLKINRKSP